MEAMSRKEKEAEILKVWKSTIKDNPDTLPSWAAHPRSFLSWSLNKYKSGYVLRVINKRYPKLLLPYNLQWIKKPKRGRPRRRRSKE